MKTKMVKILKVLERASCHCPLGYITLHTNIVEPLKMLEHLESEGYVSRCKDVEWSATNHPQFRITAKARLVLKELEVDVVKIPLKAVALTAAQT